MKRRTPAALTPERLSELVAIAERGPRREDVSSSLEYERTCRAIIQELSTALRTTWRQYGNSNIEQLAIGEHRDAEPRLA